MKRTAEHRAPDGRAEWKLRGAIADCARAVRHCTEEACALPPDQHRARQRALDDALVFANLAARLGETLAKMRPRVHVTTVEYWKNGILTRTRTTRRVPLPNFQVRMPAPSSSPAPPTDMRTSSGDEAPRPTPTIRRRGAQPGNANRRSHGRYAAPRLAAHAAETPPCPRAGQAIQRLPPQHQQPRATHRHRSPARSGAAPPAESRPQRWHTRQIR